MDMDAALEQIPVREKSECYREDQSPSVCPKGLQGDMCAVTRRQVEPCLQKSRNSVLVWGSSKGWKLGGRNKCCQRGGVEAVTVSGDKGRARPGCLLGGRSPLT